MGERVTLQGIRNREILTTKRLADRRLQEERKRGMGVWYPGDAHLDSGDYSFASWFRCVLPDGRTDMREYIEETLEPIERRAGLELGGTGSNLFADFSPGYFVVTAGANLTDTRINRAYPQYTKTKIDADTSRNHRVIPGNFLDDAVKQRIVSTGLDGLRAALILERMYAGISTLPVEPFFMSKEASFWYNKVLGKGGLFFVHVPEAFNRYIKEWEAYCKANHADTIDVQVGKYEGDKYVARLHKLTDAPLPLLSARNVLGQERKHYSRMLC